MRLKALSGVLLVMLCAGNVGAAESVMTEQVSALEEKLEQGWLSQVDISGAIEAEAGYRKDYDDIKTSDVDLTNVEVGIEAGLNDWVSGFALLKWEEDGGEGVFVDEGGISLGNLETMRYQVSVGKLYVPFGVYETSMVSDPLTLELGEVRVGAINAEFASAGFYGAVYVFNSDVSESGEDDDMIDSWGVSLGYQFASEVMNADLTAGYINNLNASGGFSDTLDKVDEYSAGGTVSAVVTVADITFIGEYLTALDDDYLATSEAKPEAWNLEIAYAFAVSDHQAGIALGYQGSQDAAFLGLPKERWLASASYELTPGLGVALEIARDEDYAGGDGGSGESADSIVCQLALEF